jgi:hypothetical protein
MAVIALSGFDYRSGRCMYLSLAAVTVIIGRLGMNDMAE